MIAKRSSKVVPEDSDCSEEEEEYHFDETKF